MKTITPTELRGNLFKLLDEVLRTKIPLEIKKGGEKLIIVPAEKTDKLQNLIPRPHAIKGDPHDLVEVNWGGEVNLDLP